MVERRQSLASDEAALRQTYQTERTAAFKTYLTSPEGRSLCSRYEPIFRQLYEKTEPDHVYAKAREATEAKIEREHFSFPEFSVWMMEQHQPQA